MSKVPELCSLHATGKTGWPWEMVEQPLPAVMPNGTTWPKISIVTPSYNQSQFLEETIRSVLLQGYPNLEYILIDGGSTDGSLEIIQKYAPWLSYWVSEEDTGQSQAINKGFAHSTGQIMAWINSDDSYAPGALFRVAQAFITQETLWVAGFTHRIDASGNILNPGKLFQESLEDWFVGSPYLQPGIFWHRRLWEKSGTLDEILNFSFDYDLLMRFIQHQPFAYRVNDHIANFRIHPSSKTSKDQLKFIQERNEIYRRYPLNNFSLGKKFYVWKKRRERKSKIFMRLKDELSLYKIILNVLWNTPWYFTRVRFLYWIKINYKNKLL